MKKLPFILVTLALLGAGCASSPPPAAPTNNPPQPAQTGCSTNSDCPGGDTCMTSGPLIAGQPPHRICVAPGQAVPL